MIAFITFKSSLVPLFEGLWSSNSWEFELSGFSRNRTDDLRIDSPSLWPTEPRLHVRSKTGCGWFGFNLWVVLLNASFHCYRNLRLPPKPTVTSPDHQSFPRAPNFTHPNSRILQHGKKSQMPWRIKPPQHNLPGNPCTEDQSPTRHHQPHSVLRKCQHHHCVCSTSHSTRDPWYNSISR